MPSLSASDWRIGSFGPGDYDEVKCAHTIFPVEYDDTFFQSVCRPDGTLVTVRASPKDAEGCLAGFAIARLALLSQASYNDRKCVRLLLGAGYSESRTATVLYLLTLGVREGYRRKGLAKLMLGIVKQRAISLGACLVTLHVSAQNAAACALYEACGFMFLRRHLKFYAQCKLATVPTDLQLGDAFLYAKVVGREDDALSASATSTVGESSHVYSRTLPVSGEDKLFTDDRGDWSQQVALLRNCRKGQVAVDVSFSECYYPTNAQNRGDRKGCFSSSWKFSLIELYRSLFARHK